MEVRVVQSKILSELNAINMNCFRYKIEHDFGFAPNPFHGTLSLATCKGDIRKNKNLQLGDWIVGLGSKSMGNLHHIVFAMKVEEKLTFDQYWNDARFLCKKPNLNGSLIEIYGDNVYHTDESTGKVIQENCAHSKDNGIVDEGHYKRDVEGQYVLLSKTFYYFGDHAPLIPEEFSYILNDSRNLKFWDLYGESQKIQKFVDWLASNYKYGIHGDPCNWKEYNLPKMDIYEE
ncbi:MULTISPECIES: hypothetical protein [Parabacteroides]|jgi:hypothetical protein|nr:MULTISPECIES: hypothetical protein [Parabacteroides]